MKPKMNQQPLNETHSTNPKYTKQNASQNEKKQPNKGGLVNPLGWKHVCDSVFESVS